MGVDITTVEMSHGGKGAKRAEINLEKYLAKKQSKGSRETSLRYDKVPHMQRERSGRRSSMLHATGARRRVGRDITLRRAGRDLPITSSVDKKTGTTNQICA